jgi:hypothetical protein
VCMKELDGDAALNVEEVRAWYHPVVMGTVR